mgnify:CR=1 FL=1
MSTKTKTKTKTQQQLIQEAAELLQQERIAREQAFIQEYDALVKKLCEKYKCNIGFKQPQLQITAL